MNTSLINICLNRLCLLPVDSNSRSAGFNYMAAFQAELLNAGYYVNNLSLLREYSKEEYSEIIFTLLEMKGGNVVHSPLFKKFPAEYPQSVNNIYYDILAFFGIHINENNRTHEMTITSVPQTEQQVLNALEEIKTRKAADNIKIVELEIVTEEEAIIALKEWARSLIYSPVVVNENYWEDIWFVVNNFNLEVELTKIKVKETLVRFATKDWNQYNKISVRTATDLLRLFAYLKEQDVSLAEKINLKGLKFSRPRRRAIMAFINSDKCRVEDMYTYRQIWKKVFSGLHPYEYKNQFPRAIEKIKALQNDEIRSLESSAINANSKEETLALYSTRPGLFLRNIGKLQYIIGNEELICEYLSQLDLSSVPIPTLLTAIAALSHTSTRTVINKKGKAFNIEARKSPIGFDLAISLTHSLYNRVEGMKPEWKDKKIYIDPSLIDIIIPTKERKSSEALINIARGSRLPIDNDIVRIFMYWKEANGYADYDLSVRYFDENWRSMGQVSWNAYGNNSDLKHSGDITSAPYGASEFIDIHMQRLADRNVRYVVPSMLRFGGETFEQLDIFFGGYMERSADKLDEELVFDPKTVATKISANRCKAQYYYPFVFDVVDRKVVFVDLYGGGRNTIESNGEILKTAENFVNYNGYDYMSYIEAIRLANGGIVVNKKEEADIVIDLDYVLSLYGQDCYTLPGK